MHTRLRPARGRTTAKRRFASLRRSHGRKESQQLRMHRVGPRAQVPHLRDHSRVAVGAVRWADRGRVLQTREYRCGDVVTSAATRRLRRNRARHGLADVPLRVCTPKLMRQLGHAPSFSLRFREDLPCLFLGPVPVDCSVHSPACPAACLSYHPRFVGRMHRCYGR
jgi:hypothetical protein